MTHFLYFDGRVAWDGWAHYRCRIEERERRGRTQWRYVIERRFVTTSDWKRGWWCSDKAKVLQRAERKLAGLEKRGQAEGEYL